MKTPSLLSPRAALLRHRLAPAAALLLSFSPLPADNLPLTPVIQSATSLAGERMKLVWSPQSNVRYRVEKSTSLSPEGEGAWSTRALVEGGEWLDPEPPGPRAFYRVPAAAPEVFSVYPTVLGPAGGVLIIEGQCLPAGSSLVFEIEGAPPVVLPLMPGVPGTYRAALPAGAVVPGANILSATIRWPNEVILIDIKEGFVVTETGRAADVPPVPPPALEWVATVWNKQCVEKDTSVSLVDYNYRVKKMMGCPRIGEASKFGISPDVDCDGDDDDPAPFNSLLMPALMKAKEKASRAKCSNNLSQIGLRKEEGGRHTPFHNRCMPGEVVLEQDDLFLDTPAGPPIVWTSTYRSRGGGGGGGGGGWNSCYDIRIEPIPLAAGVSAKRLYLYGGDGRRDVLYRQADGSYTCTGMFREGRFNLDTSFTLTFADKSQFIFCRLVGAPWSGRIGRIQDRNGVGLDFTYTAAAELHTVTSQFGQSLTCAYGTDRRLSSITDHTGRLVEFDYFGAGEPGGSSGDLKSVSCPRAAGEAPLAGPTTFTYTTGHADDRLNHNLLTARDGAARLLAAYTYSSSTDPLAVDFDTCTTENLHGTLASSVEFATIKMEIGAAGYKMLVNDEVGRVTECDFDVMHRCVAVREYTGFAKPGMPVTSATNRPDPAKKLRAGDPEFYETTFRYNADSCVTRITHPDGTQERFTYGRELRKDCPVRERGNAHLITLRTAGGEERTVTCDYLPGFGSCEYSGGEFMSKLRLLNSHGGGGGGGCGGLSSGGRAHVDDIDHLSNRRVRSSLAGGGSGGGYRKILDYGEAGDSVTQGQGAKAKAWMVNNYEVHPIFGLKTEWINSIGLPKVTPKISKESHGKRGSPGGLTGRPVGQPAAAGLGTHVQRLITSHGQVFTWSYDTRGNCLSSRTPVAGSGCDAIFNSLGQCTSVTVLNGPGSSFREDFTYHAVSGWLTGHIQDPDVNGTGAGLHITTTVERDDLGRIIRCVDPRGFDWLTEYDVMDRETVSRSAGGGINGINGGMPNRISMNRYYNPGGDPVRVDIEHRDAAGALVADNPAYTGWLIYDDRGRVSRIALEQRPVDAGVVVTPVNNPPVIDPALYAVTDFTYNDAGECVQLTVPAASRGQSTDRVCLTYYDERGKEWECQDGIAGTPGSTTVQYDYTPAGMVSRRMLLPTLPPPPPFAPNPETVWIYDGFQRVSSITDPMGNVTRYEYDEQGFTTVSVFGEVNDLAGSAGNVLLARGRTREYCVQYRESDFDFITRRAINTKGPPYCPKTKGRFRPAFFDVFVADDEWTWERFAPGAPAPHATETTTVLRSPAGLVMSVSSNGDTLFSCGYDTAGRQITCQDAFILRVTVRDQAGNVILDRRTDQPTAPGFAPKQFTVAHTYDALGRHISSTDGGGNNENWSFDSCSRPTQFTDARRVVHRFEYDGEIPGTAGAPPEPFTVLHQCDVLGNGFMSKLRTLLCASGERVRSTNSNGYTTTFIRDSADNLTQCGFPDGTHETHGFDNYGRHNSITHKDGTVVLADFDRDGRPDVVTYSGGPPGAVPVPPVDYTYNGLGDPVQCDQGDSHLRFTYDSLGNQLSESHNGRTLTSTFTHRGRSSIAYPDGTRFGEVRDHFGNLVSVSRLNSAGAALSPPVSQAGYLGDRPVVETRANGVVTTYEYRGDGDAALPGGAADFSFDACVRVHCVRNGSTISMQTIRRNQNQCLTQCDTAFSGAPDTAGRRQTITLDRLDRLIRCVTTRREVTGGPGTLESDVSYTLDLDGRRLTASGGRNPGAYTQNPLNPPGDHQMGQYSSWSDGLPLEWDAQGCLTLMSRASGPMQCSYDAASRLVAVTDFSSGAPQTTTYAYDAMGRRTRSNDTFFVYDGFTCVQELGGDGLPNFTMAAAGGIHLCITSRNGTLVYPHGGPKVVVAGSNSLSGSSTFAHGRPANGGARVVVAGSNSLSSTSTFAHGRPGNGDARVVVAGSNNLSGSSTFAYAPAGDDGTVFTNADGLVTERTDCDDGGFPIFLTGTGLPRQGATDTLSGYRWMAPECIWCPESRFLQGHGGLYSPELGTAVSAHKTKPKPKEKPALQASWNLQQGTK